MKKLLNKLRRTKQPKQPQRITNETIAEHRERILAGGRRFKYPVQYARHKLVFNAIIISVSALVLLVGLFWYLLFVAQNTSEVVYRLTRVIPVPVARVDGQFVRYSEYLMKYRSSIHYYVEKERINLSSEDGKRQADFVKSMSMEDAIADAYAQKLAKELNITVTNEELETFLLQQRASPEGEVSESTYDAVILDYYGWSHDEYRHAMQTKLLRQKVAFAVDETAKKNADTITSRIKGGSTNLKDLSDELKKTDMTNITYSALGLLPKANRDGGLTAAAAKLTVGQVSDAIRTTNGDGYYFVRLLESNDAQVSYESILVPLTTFTDRLKATENGADKVTKYIDIPELTTPAAQ
jgi:hypothetical protein